MKHDAGSVGLDGPTGSPIDCYGHYKSLDGLRAVAILAVMVYHLPNNGGLHGGFLGVDMFFVLSGFLITTLLIGEHEKHNRIRLRAFYARRVLRLFPGLAVVTVSSIVLVLTVSGFAHLSYRHETISGLPATIFFFGNWLHVNDHAAQGLLSAMWSLAIEEQFYLFWPLCFLLAFSRVPRLFAFRILAAVGLLSMLYAILGLRNGWSLSRIYFGSDTHSCGLIVGCALAFLIPSVRVPNGTLRRGLLKMTAVLATVLILLMTRFAQRSDPTTLALSISVAVMATAVLVFNQIVAPANFLQLVLESAPARWIGKRSYGLYIWHLAIYATVFTVPRLANQPLALGDPLIILLSFLAAASSYRFLERPVLERWKGRFQQTEALPVATE